MIQLRWLVIGVLVGLLLDAVVIPPTRKKITIPQPNDSSVYHTDSGCVRFVAVEVPCVAEPESLNLLASLSKAK